MRVNLTPPEIVVKIQDVEFVFHMVNSLTAAEVRIVAMDIKEPKQLIQKLSKYLKEIKGLEDSEGNKLGKEHLASLPASIIYKLCKDFVVEAGKVSDGFDGDLEAEEKNLEASPSSA